MKNLLLGVSALVFLSTAAFAEDQWPQPSWLDHPVPNDAPGSPITAPRGPAIASNDLPLLQEQDVRPYPVAQAPQPIQQAQPTPQYKYPTDAYTPSPETYSDVRPASGKRSTSAEDVLFSATVGAVTDYRHRGISRSDELPALQARAKLQYNGVYGGIDGSTVDLNTDPDAYLETKFSGGYKGVFDGLDYDAQLGYTAYPGGDNDDEAYWEFILTGGYDFDAFYGSVTWAASPDYINNSGMSFYYGADLAAPLPVMGGMDLTAKAHLGFQFVGDNGPYISDDATDWNLGLYYNVPDYDIDLGISYTGTNLDDVDCREECGSRALLSATKDFGW